MANPVLPAKFNLGTYLGEQIAPQLQGGLSKGINQGYEAGVLGNALKKLHPNASAEDKMNALYGLPISNETKQPMMKHLAAQATQEQKHQEQKHQGIETAFSALSQLEGMVGKKGIGLSGQVNYSDEAMRNRGRFSSLQAAILPLFKTLFPRGMTEKEFKFIQSNYIPQSSDTEETIRGKIEGLQAMFPNEMRGAGAPQQMPSQAQIPQEQQQSQEYVHMRDPSGTIRKVPKSQANQARAAGGVLLDGQ